MDYTGIPGSRHSTGMNTGERNWGKVMNIAIVGKNESNGILGRRLADKGLTPVFLGDATHISGVCGEKGSFVIDSTEGRIEAGCIIINGKGAAPKSGTLHKNIPAITLSELINTGTLNDLSLPVVFLMDINHESPAAMTGIALRKSIELARRKKKVLYLARFLRTEGAGFEHLYREARRCGVTFVKYENCEVDYNSDSNLFDIRASDGYGDIRIKSYVLVTADEFVPDESMADVLRALKLRTDSRGFPERERYFLFPVFSNRKGIYVLNYADERVDVEDLLFRIDFLVNEIMRDFSGVPVEKHAEVDAGKCAFCYTCYRACPHGAMTPDYENSAMKNLEKECFACGICVSICPAKAIEIKDECKKDECKDEYKKERQAGTFKTLKVFCCENSGEIALKDVLNRYYPDYDKIDVSSQSCGGDISAEKIVAALKDCEKVLVVTCMDEACKHFDGNRRAFLQVERAKNMMKASGLDENRVAFARVSHAMPLVLYEYIEHMIS